MSDHPDPGTQHPRPESERPAEGPPDDAEDFSPQLADLEQSPTADDPEQGSPAG